MELNREQIIKALECCSLGDCYPCPYSKWKAGCRDEMCGDALALIKELTEENERLNNRITCQIVIPDEKLEEIKNECLERVELDIKAIQADTVEKIKLMFAMSFGTYTDKDMTPITEVFRLIDQIAKEMLDE